MRECAIHRRLKSKTRQPASPDLVRPRLIQRAPFHTRFGRDVGKKHQLSQTPERSSKKSSLENYHFCQRVAAKSLVI